MLRWFISLMLLRLDFSSPKIQAPAPASEVAPAAPSVDKEAEAARARAAADAERKAASGGRESTISGGRDISVEEIRRSGERKRAASELLG